MTRTRPTPKAGSSKAGAPETGLSEAKRPGAAHGRSVPRAGPARQLLGAGATLVTCALLIRLGGWGEAAGPLFIVGFGATLVGLHRVGRLGPAELR